jgi:hypothetical protein
MDAACIRYEFAPHPIRSAFWGGEDVSLRIFLGDAVKLVRFVPFYARRGTLIVTPDGNIGQLHRISLGRPVRVERYGAMDTVKYAEFDPSGKSAKKNAMTEWITKRETVFEDALRGSVGMFLMGLVTSLCSLALFVPGIIASLSLFLTPYLLKDYPELTIMETLRLSRKMMKGHKMQLFMLQLSFIGWILLNVLTLGLGSLWLTPYMMTTLAAFYHDVREQYIMKEGLQGSAL